MISQEKLEDQNEKTSIENCIEFIFSIPFKRLVPNRLQYKTTMGKRLRNPKLKQQSSTTSTKEKTMLSTSLLHGNKLKKMINKKFYSDSLQHKHLSNCSIYSEFNKRWRDGSLDAIIDQSKLECPICLELMVQPTMMSCGHIYCFRCLESSTAHNQKCCLCRQQQLDQPQQLSQLAQSLINKYKSQNSRFLLPRSKEVIKYLCRTSDCSEWMKRRYVNNMRQGLIVDFQDGLNMWRRAIVVRTFYAESEEKMMVVLKMYIKGTQFFQTVQAGSKRLAPSKFFTKGKYLEEFSPSLPEYDFRQKELYSLEYRRDRIDQQIFMNQNIENEEGQVQNFEEQFEPLEVQQNREDLLDQALVIFNLQMTENDLIY